MSELSQSRVCGACRCCKTHARGGVRASDTCALRSDLHPCPGAAQPRSRLAQGKPAGRGKALGFVRTLRVAGLAAWLSMAQTPCAAAECGGPALPFVAIGPDLWLVPAQPGEADADNRGRVSNLVLARDGRRWWLLGSGPSPAMGRALACQARLRLGARITDVVSPWARPELVLGFAGMPPARHWAHAKVTAAMRDQCPVCVERLRTRLGAAAADLGERPVALPAHLLHGDRGRLGPFRWWLLPRAPGRWVTVWRHQASAGALAEPDVTWIAHGLLAAAPPGDGREAELALLESGLRRLQDLARPDGGRARWVGEQGGVQTGGETAEQARYWRDLLAAAAAAIDSGVAESAPPPPLPGWSAAVTGHPWHALNWQRAWRQVEARELGPDASVPPAR